MSGRRVVHTCERDSSPVDIAAGADRRRGSRGEGGGDEGFALDPGRWERGRREEVSPPSGEWSSRRAWPPRRLGEPPAPSRRAASVLTEEERRSDEEGQPDLARRCLLLDSILVELGSDGVGAGAPSPGSAENAEPPMSWARYPQGFLALLQKPSNRTLPINHGTVLCTRGYRAHGSRH